MSVRVALSEKGFGESCSRGKGLGRDLGEGRPGLGASGGAELLQQEETGSVGGPGRCYGAERVSEQGKAGRGSERQAAGASPDVPGSCGRVLNRLGAQLCLRISLCDVSPGPLWGKRPQEPERSGKATKPRSRHCDTQVHSTSGRGRGGGPSRTKGLGPGHRGDTGEVL